MPALLFVGHPSLCPPSYCLPEREMGGKGKRTKRWWWRECPCQEALHPVPQPSGRATPASAWGRHAVGSGIVSSHFPPRGPPPHYSAYSLPALSFSGVPYPPGSLPPVLRT